MICRASLNEEGRGEMMVILAEVPGGTMMLSWSSSDMNRTNFTSSMSLKLNCTSPALRMAWAAATRSFSSASESCAAPGAPSSWAARARAGRKPVSRDTVSSANRNLP